MPKQKNLRVDLDTVADVINFQVKVLEEVHGVKVQKIEFSREYLQLVNDQASAQLIKITPTFTIIL